MAVAMGFPNLFVTTIKSQDKVEEWAVIFYFIAALMDMMVALNECNCLKYLGKEERKLKEKF